jgi:nucleoside-diphosphate-sugar epimerase
VTGVAGFIGSHLADRLVLDSHDVVGIDSFLPYYPRPLKEANLRTALKAANFRFVEGDLNDLPLVDLLADREWVFHLAAQPGVRSSWGRDFETYMRSNIGGTQKLLEAAAQTPSLRRLVFASSSSVYGNATSLPVREEAGLDPISPYGMTKMMAERLCLLYAGSFGVPAVCLRYFTVYGPRQRPDMAFHIFGKALLEGREFSVYGSGRQTRDFTFVADVLEANLAAASAPKVEGTVMNIGGGSRVSLSDAIRALEELSGYSARVRYQENARGDVTDTYADISLAGRVIGYQPRVSLREGLKAQLEYLRTLYLPTGSASVP